MTVLSTPEKLKIDLYKPAPKPAIVPGTFSDPNLPATDLPYTGKDYAKEVLEKLPKSPPKPAKVVDRPKVQT